MSQELQPRCENLKRKLDLQPYTLNFYLDMQAEYLNLMDMVTLEIIILCAS